MKKKNKQQTKILNIVSDAIIVFVSYVIAMWLFYRFLGGEITINPFAGRFLLGAAILGIVMAFCYQAVHTNYLSMIAVTAFGTLALMAIFFVYRVIDFSRLSLVVFFVINSVLILSKHALGHKLVADLYAKRKVLIVGQGKTARQCALDTGYPVAAEPSADYDELIIALDPEDSGRVPEILSFADKEGLYVSMVPFFSEYIPSHPEIEAVGKSKMINLRATPLDNVANAAVKRIGDVLGSLFLIVLTSPLMLIAVIGVKLSSPGPVLFKQTRVGKDRKNFNMLKFRSMKVNSTQDTAWSKNTDSRRTKFGSFIRKYSIDELPQFFNVLKGDMSLVGPRPEIPHFVQQFKETVPLYLVRQQVRPGITGWAQINGLRGDTSIEDRVEHDIWYIENWSIGLDIAILFRTVFGGEFKNNEQ